MNHTVERPPRSDRWWPLLIALCLLLVALALIGVTAVGAGNSAKTEELFCDGVERITFECPGEVETDLGSAHCVRLEGDEYRSVVSFGDQALVLNAQLVHDELPWSYVLIETGDLSWRSIPRRDGVFRGEIGLREGVLCGELQGTPFALVADSLMPLRSSDHPANSWFSTFLASFGTGSGLVAWILVLLAMPCLILWRQRS